MGGPVSSPQRQAKILNLTWNEIDLRNRFVRLGGLLTINKTGRVIPLHQKIADYLQSLPRPIHGGFIFEHRCLNIKAFMKALSLTGIEDFTFHD